jgi:hypothetical protein
MRPRRLSPFQSPLHRGAEFNLRELLRRPLSFPHFSPLFIGVPSSTQRSAIDLKKKKLNSALIDWPGGWLEAANPAFALLQVQAHTSPCSTRCPGRLGLGMKEQSMEDDQARGQSGRARTGIFHREGTWFFYHPSWREKRRGAERPGCGVNDRRQQAAKAQR